MLTVNLLAQTSGTDAATTANAETASFAEALSGAWRRMDILNRPDELLDLLVQMPVILAAVIFTVGILCVLNGYRWHRWVVVVLALLAGFLIGQQLSNQFGKSSIVAVALAALCGIIATPMMKIAVAIFGGLTGAFIGANAWTAISGADASHLHWAGAAMGFIILAMASFIFFRVVVVLFTSIGGAAMIVFGAVTLMMQVPSWEEAVRRSLVGNQLLMPILVTVAAVGGIVVQNHRNHAEPLEE